MKQKTIYIILVVCCLSLFSSAKQYGKTCVKDPCCKYSKQKAAAKEAALREQAQKAYDISPLHHFLLSI